MRFPSYEIPGLTPEQQAAYSRNLHEIEQRLVEAFGTDPTPLFGKSGGTNELRIQAGLASVVTSAAGDVAITFPVTFPKGVLLAVVQNFTGGLYFFVVASAATATGFIATCVDHAGNTVNTTAVSLSWIALGW